ncbi:hypothetical protein LIA77_08524 [Sarocladium implicatum]|nr:hypothetical protein LIA77_08524 [Sarocladium implicatum]
MPSRVNDSASSRFELPALDLNFGSITDGTDIPPPPDSPVQKEPTPPRTPVATSKPETQPTPAVKEQPAVAPKQTTSNGNIAGTKRPADDIPPSPTASTRPGSLRRLFSRNTLNNIYAEGQQTQSNGNGSAAGSVQRPMSRSGSSFLDDRKSKRSSGWFKRLTGDGAAGRRSSLMLDESSPVLQNKPTGPPPPMIPELKEFEKEDSGFGSDLFKNIK